MNLGLASAADTSKWPRRPPTPAASASEVKDYTLVRPILAQPPLGRASASASASSWASGAPCSGGPGTALPSGRNGNPSLQPTPSLTTAFRKRERERHQRLASFMPKALGDGKPARKYKPSSSSLEEELSPSSGLAFRALMHRLLHKPTPYCLLRYAKHYGLDLHRPREQRPQARKSSNLWYTNANVPGSIWNRMPSPRQRGGSSPKCFGKPLGGRPGYGLSIKASTRIRLWPTRGNKKRLRRT